MPSPLPPLLSTSADFAEIRRKGGLYVDKTPYLARMLVSSGADDPALKPDTQYAFLARPRRFGKSLLIATLEAWFQGMPDAADPWPDWLFAGTALESAWQARRGVPVRPVIRLDLSRAGDLDPGRIERSLCNTVARVSTRWAQRGVEFPQATTYRDSQARPDIRMDDSQKPGDWLLHLIDRLSLHYAARPVVLIDEYDAPITHLLGHAPAELPLPRQSACLDVLRDFYGTLKQADDNLHFTFITGISRFAHPNLFSALNNLQDLSWDDDYAGMCGFTEAEVATRLGPYMACLAAWTQQATAQIQGHIRAHYNGYCFGTPGRAPAIYNPFTVLRALQHNLKSSALSLAVQEWPESWADSGNPAFLVRILKQQQYPLRAHPRTRTALWKSSFDLNRIPYDVLMLQTGYYTLVGQDDQGRMLLDYPNTEVRNAYLHALWIDAWPDTALPTHRLYTDLHQALQEGRYPAFIIHLETFLASIPGEKLRCESDYHLVLHVLCMGLQVQFGSEGHVWGGRYDLAVRFPEHVCIMELKYGARAAEALRQILKRGYHKPFRVSPCQRIDCLGLNFRKRPGENDAPGATVEYELLILTPPWDQEAEDSAAVSSETLPA